MNMNYSSSLLVLLTFIASTNALVHGLASNTAFVEIVNPLKASTDKLPTSIASTWPTWVLLCEEQGVVWTKIPNDGDYVNPVSFDEVWHPLDLRLPSLRLAVAVHVRDGVPRHILPALDLTLSCDAAQHRNRGLNTVPRASIWMDVTAYIAGSRQCSMKLDVSDKNEDSWETIARIDSVKSAVDRVFQALAEDPPTELGSGSSIVHAVMARDGPGIEMPKPGKRLRLVLMEDSEDAVGQLDVEIKPISPGSKSEYLPPAYKRLFQNPDCLSPAYLAFSNEDCPATE